MFWNYVHTKDELKDESNLSLMLLISHLHSVLTHHLTYVFWTPALHPTNRGFLKVVFSALDGRNQHQEVPSYTGRIGWAPTGTPAPV